MILKWGEEYRGAGQADPKKSRAEREAELQALSATEHGSEVIEYYFLKYTGGLRGEMPPIGAPMIQTILDREYPRG